MRTLWRILKWILVGMALITGIFLAWYHIAVPISPPQVDDTAILHQKRQQVGPDFYRLGGNWLKKDSTGLWQLYVEGAPFERGAAAGILCQDLLHAQEAAFVEGIDNVVHSRIYLFLLKHLVAIFTRHLPDYVDLEYQQEIYGISLKASDEFDFIGPKFQRKLNFHAAHDIGHALQTQGLVAGCSMLASIPPDSSGTPMILGRNFDFYVGDAFARQKLITFMRPDAGIPFAMIGWPGMMGAVSGMNTHGLAIMLNAGPSKMPRQIGTPVTLLARKVLQYASTIAEAEQMIRQAEIFVSENIIVASGSERRVVVFEKSPQSTVRYESDADMLICTNHFISAENADDPQNQIAQKNTSTLYRYKRLNELAATRFTHDIGSLANILRDTRGLHDTVLALGSEQAVAQLTAHHSVLFEPEAQILWVACKPSQLGPYLGYRLTDVCAGAPATPTGTIHDPALTIPADPLLDTEAYRRYARFHELTGKIRNASQAGVPVDATLLEAYEALNPTHYLTYLTLGNYYVSRGDCPGARGQYEKGLLQPLGSEHDRQLLLSGICVCDRDDARCP